MTQDTTVRIFDEFYNLDVVVSASEYEIVYSFFKEYTSDITIAKSYTESLFRISSYTQINVLDLLSDFKATDGLKITLTLAYYLNSMSDKTVMYGVNTAMTPNNSVQRNIVQ